MAPINRQDWAYFLTKAGATHSMVATPMSSVARDARLKAVECEKRAAVARDPETRRYYIQLARDWWEMARQNQRLEADLRDLARKEN